MIEGSYIYLPQYPIYTKDILNYLCLLSMVTLTSEAWTNQSPKNVNTYLHTYLLASKTMRGSLYFPIAPKGEVPKPWEGPYFPILVSMPCHLVKNGPPNRGNRDPFMVWHFIKEKHWEGPIFPKGEVPKPWECPYFSYFPYFGGLCVGKMKR